MTMDRILRHPNLCSGKPCVRGMRIPVYIIVSRVAAGKTAPEIIDDFP